MNYIINTAISCFPWKTHFLYIWKNACPTANWQPEFDIFSSKNGVSRRVPDSACSLTEWVLFLETIILQYVAEILYANFLFHHSESVYKKFYYFQEDIKWNSSILSPECIEHKCLVPLPWFVKMLAVLLTFPFSPLKHKNLSYSTFWLFRDTSVAKLLL